MLYFINDYSEGAHPTVLERLVQTNMEKLAGYGEDTYTLSAKEKIKEAIGKPDAKVYFISGGTQTNQLTIDTMLEAYEGVITASSGHIMEHEAGAIEFTGHKVISLEHQNGKLMADRLQAYLERFFADAHHNKMVFPGMVYISQPTEYGTLYSKKELENLSDICHRYELSLFVDGARLGYGLATPENDVTLKDIANLCDAFYIGGTKVGALCGEALVFTKNEPKQFLTRIKQHGALLAKGRLCGVQFDALFTDGLYLQISQSAITTARRIKDALAQKGYQIFIGSPTNQTFVVMENQALAKFGEKVRYDFWEKYDDNHTVIRLCTSWATTDADVDALIKLL